MTDQVARHLTVAEAAGALGVSEHAIRRRIRSGELLAERVQRPQGYIYLVTLPAAEHLAPDSATSQLATPPPSARSQLAPRSASRQEPESVTMLRALEMLAAKDAEIAVERARSTQLEQERAELYGRLGYFQAQLEQAQTQIKALAAPKEPVPGGNAVLPPAEPPKRPWWAFWR